MRVNAHTLSNQSFLANALSHELAPHTLTHPPHHTHTHPANQAKFHQNMVASCNRFCPSPAMIIQKIGPRRYQIRAQIAPNATPCKAPSRAKCLFRPATLAGNIAS